MIAILLADGFEEVEALTSYDLLRRAGCDVRLISLEETIAGGAHGVIVCTDVYARAVNPDDIELLILPGGMPGVKNLDASEYTDKFISSVMERGARIGAICAAPMLLGKRGLLKGRIAACYPGFEDELKDATVVYAPVITSGNITTSRGAGTAVDFALELVKLMNGDDEMIKIADAIVYKSPYIDAAKARKRFADVVKDTDEISTTFINVANLVFECRRADSLIIQHRLQLSFAKVRKHLNLLHKLGVIDKPDGMKPANLLITRDEWENMLSTKIEPKKKSPVRKIESDPVEEPESVRLYEFDYTDDEENRVFKYDFEMNEEFIDNEPVIKKKYKLPSIDLLSKSETVSEDYTEEVNTISEKILNVLNTFAAGSVLRSVERGPRITRYELVPAKGVRVTKVLKLFDDIALDLGLEGTRMQAPIPGKSSIGIEVANRTPSVVRIRELIDDDTFKNEKSKTFVAIGRDVGGEPVYADVSKMPHLIVAGATGMGKSVCINNIITSILYKAKPDEVKFILIDPKRVEFGAYSKLPHLLFPIITDVREAVGALRWAYEEMNRRYELMSKTMTRKLDAYNEHVTKYPELGKPLPKIVVIIDELNDIMLQVKKQAEPLITGIAQKARAAGIHLIVATQRPTVDVITGVVKANIPSRIAFKVASYSDSKSILDFSGAEKLLNRGDMLYIAPGKSTPTRIQCAFVSDSEISTLADDVSTKYPVCFDRKLLEQLKGFTEESFKKVEREELDPEEYEDYLSDKTFLDILCFAVNNQKISTSLMQRKFSVGYSKAAKIIDAMEAFGFITEPRGQKPRDVLLTQDELLALLARVKHEGNDSSDNDESVEPCTADEPECEEESYKSYLNDKEFIDMLRFAADKQKLSTSLLQRNFNIGYGKAAKIIDVMEYFGFVSEANGQKPRDVLLTKDELILILEKAPLEESAPEVKAESSVTSGNDPVPELLAKLCLQPVGESDEDEDVVFDEEPIYDPFEEN